MDGQADLATAADDFDDIADFLADNPNVDREEGAGDDGEPATGTALANTSEDNPDDGEADAPEDDEGSGSRQVATTRAGGLSWQIPIKGEDGVDTGEIATVGEKELIDGYWRQADYSRKTVALKAEAEKMRSDHAQEVAKDKTEHREFFLQQAQTIRGVFLALAEFKSPQEMQALAMSNPGEAMAEQMRMQRITGAVQQVEQMMQGEIQKAREEQEKAHRDAVSRCWLVLGREGLNKESLGAIFKRVISDYGVPEERFQRIDDPALCLIMRDAIRYRDAMKKKAQATKKVTSAPVLPQRTAQPPSTRAKQADKRIRTGKGDIHDLARFV